MPSRVDPLRVGKALDARIKLTDADRQEIRDLYGIVSQRALAKRYGVSRRLVIFIGNPESYTENLKRRAERGGSMAYYDKSKHKDYMAKHRKRKLKLLLKGKK